MISFAKESAQTNKAANDADLLSLIQNKKANIAIIGLGYVGLPLAVNAALKDLNVTGFDTDKAKIKRLNKNESYIEAVKNDQIADVRKQKFFKATDDYSALKKADVIVICVPTPLTPHMDPDLSYVMRTCDEIAKHMSPGVLIILESTTFPGTTHDIMVPYLEKTGYKCNEDFYAAFSPEREDPGNPDFGTTQIPKIVGGENEYARDCAVTFYELFFDKVEPVSSTQIAEAIKLTENIFRSVNIALVNELKIIYDSMGLDIWEIIRGASTKPFGYMPFYPGPGVGGHCIPIDPFYLSWKALEHGQDTRFIRLAGEINAKMPAYILGKIRSVLDDKKGLGLKKSRILVSGLAYKKNVADVRESPAVHIFDLLKKSGAHVDYYDPHEPEIPEMRRYPDLKGIQSVDFKNITADSYDIILIATDHDNVDYNHYINTGLPIVDTRNIIERLELPMNNVFKA